MLFWLGIFSTDDIKCVFDIKFIILKFIVTQVFFLDKGQMKPDYLPKYNMNGL